jgi:hypothetical protein
MASSDFHPRPHFTVDTACLLHVSPLTSKLPLQSSSPPHHARRSPIARDPVHGVEKIQRNRVVTTNVTAGPRIRLRCVTRFRETSKLDARVGLVANRELAVMNGRRMCFASSFLPLSLPKKSKIYHRLTTRPLRRELLYSYSSSDEQEELESSL